MLIQSKYSEGFQHLQGYAFKPSVFKDLAKTEGRRWGAVQLLNKIHRDIWSPWARCPSVRGVIAMGEFLEALREAERVLQETWDFLLKHKNKTAREDKDWAQHLISVVKSVLILLDRYGIPEIPGFKPHNFSGLKVALKKLQTKLEAI